MSARRAGRRPTGLESVLRAIAQTAARLCEARDALIYLVDGDQHRLVAQYGRVPQTRRLGDTHPVRRDTPLGLGVLSRRTVHIRDIHRQRHRFPGLAALGLRVPRVRTMLVMPLLRDGVALGGIVIRRTRVRPFRATQIALLRTFADQAVIAIENARLSEALGTRNRELTESLERQTATAEILRVISGAHRDVRPVFDQIIRSVVHLCGALNGGIFRLEAGLLAPVSYAGATTPEWDALFRTIAPRAPTRETVGGWTILEQGVLHVPDIEADDRFRTAHRLARTVGARSILAVPLVREGVPLGAIVLHKAEPFPDREFDLLRTFADHAVIAIENVRLFTELEARNRDLTEALEQQTATAEILRVISASPTDVQPVFDTIARNALRLCEGYHCSLFRFDGERQYFVAHHGVEPETVEALRHRYPRPPDPETATGRALLEGAVIHVPDIRGDSRFPESQQITARAGYRAVLAVPMFREQPIGAVFVVRREARAFSDAQIELVKTFADQAVIAIENVRLFTELQTSNRELTEALEQQTATAEILRVISSSPTDIQPVFEAIIRSAVSLCDGVHGIAMRLEGGRLHLAAHFNVSAGALEELEEAGPRAPTRDYAAGRAVVDRARVHVLTKDAIAREFPAMAARANVGSILAVPLLREGQPIGAITITRSHARAFTERQIALLQTFADQAVIAIENVRLFTELQTRNRELTEALDRQTATAEILRAISSSPTDTQPVFDAIIASAVRLCGAHYGMVWRFDGEMVHFVSHHNIPPEELEETRSEYPRRDGDGLVDQVLRSGMLLEVPDTDRYEHAPPRLHERWRARGVRSFLMMPMRRGAEIVGVIGVTHRGIDAFTPSRRELLRTFADQAVIAIENVRLFTALQQRTHELTRSVEQLTALGEIGRAVSSTLDLDTVLTTIADRASQLASTRGCSIWEYDEGAEVFRLRATTVLDREVAEALGTATIRKGEGAVGRAALTRTPVQIPDVSVPGAYQGQLRDALIRAGGGSVLTIPLLHEDRLVGGLTVSRRVTGEFPPDVVALLTTFAAQSAIAIDNARLFRELEAKSRELEVASRHKSQFLANMSHELRTPLNAILGYGELMADGIYGDVPPPMRDVLGRVDASGRHLLGLINDVLDLSKIEAGQLTLALAEYSMTEVVESAVASVGALAADKGLPLAVDLAPDLPTGRGDQRRLMQVVLNLIGNAIKFTEEGGIGVQVVAPGDAFEISVRDTGPGIAPADQERIFAEFQQADTSTTRPKGGTGLGLAIARRIVALHGGRLWVESTPGEGSTFRLTVPVRVEQQAALA